VRLRNALFLSRRLDLLEARFCMSLLDLPLFCVSTFLEGVVASPDSVQVEDSSGSHGALS
jgi:hypothetical protein